MSSRVFCCLRLLQVSSGITGSASRLIFSCPLAAVFASNDAPSTIRTHHSLYKIQIIFAKTMPTGRDQASRLWASATWTTTAGSQKLPFYDLFNYLIVSAMRSNHERGPQDNLEMGWPQPRFQGMSAAKLVGFIMLRILIT